MYGKIFFFIFSFLIINQACFAMDDNVFVQTLNMGDEEYFLEDTTVYPDSSSEYTPAPVQYVENNYNYVPQVPYGYTTYRYPNSYGSYTVTTPWFYVPNYKPNFHNPGPPHNNWNPPMQQMPPVQKPVQQGTLRPATQRPFTFNYGYATPHQTYSPAFQTNLKK